ncbi:MAG: hypothetical protein GEU75_10405 [Dehalococcoidia bacterium]|nr:hypothetical protein [Dehalococcoidia bacterium]
MAKRLMTLREDQAAALAEVERLTEGYTISIDDVIYRFHGNALEPNDLQQIDVFTVGMRAYLENPTWQALRSVEEGQRSLVRAILPTVPGDVLARLRLDQLTEIVNAYLGTRGRRSPGTAAA